MHAGIGLGVSTNGFQSFSSLDISGRWDRFYFELKHISKAYGDQEKQALSSSLFSDAPPRAEWDRMSGERQLHYQKQKWPKMTIAERERYLQQMAPDDQSRFLSSMREVEEAMVLTWGQLDLTAVHHTQVSWRACECCCGLFRFSSMLLMSSHMRTSFEAVQAEQHRDHLCGETQKAESCMRIEAKEEAQTKIRIDHAISTDQKRSTPNRLR